MKILITGGSGRVGEHLVGEALERGWQVRLLQRGRSQPSSTLDRRAEIVAGSVTDPTAVRAAVAAVDAVCHLAALMPPAADTDLFETNVRGTFNILEAIRDAAARPRLIFASSDATYGTGFSDRPYPEPIDEEISPRPNNFYGTTKVICERMIADYSRLYELDYLTLRYCWVFRAAEVVDLFSLRTWDEFLPDSRRRELETIPDAVPVLVDGKGEPFTDHIVDARDAARATALAVERAELTGEAINVCGPAAFRYVDQSPAVAHALGRPLAEVQLENFHAYALDIEKADRLLGFKSRFDISSMLSEAIPGYRAP